MRQKVKWVEVQPPTNECDRFQDVGNQQSFPAYNFNSNRL
jgi:hypothetical protein